MFFITAKKNKYCYILKADTFEKLVVPRNSIFYAGLNLVYNFKSLRYLDLAETRFGNAFASGNYSMPLLNILTNLKVLVLSQNGIHHIQLETFRSSKRMQVLDLSRNKLEAITFRTECFRSLRLLDLSDNRIQMLDPDSIDQLNRLLSSPEPNDSLPKAGPIDIKLDDNPYRCTCEAVPFLIWIVASNGSYLYSLKSEMTLTKKPY